MKTIAFDANVTKGTPLGPIRGEDCTWTVLGVTLGARPTIMQAFVNAKEQSGAVASAGFGFISKQTGNEVRYINNATTGSDGFNAYLLAKECFVVTGLGYR
ncbi:MAG: hypothetical protein EXR75_00815 [Myxococcales bacterium]|nr:hypothetical protein [Myxococcales bacterium]